MPPQIPIPGADWQVWGGELVEFLRVALADPGGTLKAPVLLQGGHASAPLGRTLAGGSGITVADAGPGSTVSLSILVDNQSLQIAAGSVRISDGGVISAKLADGSVIAAKLADGAVTNAKLATGIAMNKISWPGDVNKYIRGDGSAVTIPIQIPTGMCVPYAANAAPPGTDFLPCDGAAVPRDTYANLFAVIGTLHGVGDNATTFNVPDMRGRVPVGKGVHTDVDAVGKGDATAASNRRAKHQHSVYDPGHTHPMNVTTGFDEGGGNHKQVLNDSNPTGPVTGSRAAGVKVNPEGSSISVSPLDAPSFLTLLWCIKT